MESDNIRRVKHTYSSLHPFSTLQTTPSNSYLALLPKQCTLREAKQCISKQHRLAADLLSFGVVLQMDKDKRPLDNRDRLIVLKKVCSLIQSTSVSMDLIESN